MRYCTRTDMSVFTWINKNELFFLTPPGAETSTQVHERVIIFFRNCVRNFLLNIAHLILILHNQDLSFDQQMLIDTLTKLGHRSVQHFIFHYIIVLDISHKSVIVRDLQTDTSTIKYA